MPKTLFQTYMHDDHPEFLADFERTFCNDDVLLETLVLHAGDSGAHLIRNLRQPAHKADVFRYIHHYHYGGLYLDIKIALRIPLSSVLSCMAKEWDNVQVRRSTELGLLPRRGDGGTAQRVYDHGHRRQGRPYLPRDHLWSTPSPPHVGRREPRFQ